MLNAGGTLYLSASDLVGHLNCRHLTNLDLAVAKGELAKPSVWDPMLELLAHRGTLHEAPEFDPADLREVNTLGTPIGVKTPHDDVIAVGVAAAQRSAIFKPSHRVRVGSGFDRQALRRVLDELERR
jgi:hypothetical protein